MLPNPPPNSPPSSTPNPQPNPPPSSTPKPPPSPTASSPPNPPAGDDHSGTGPDRRGTARHADRRYELVYLAAADLASASSAYQAELLVSALLGSIYTVASSEAGQPLDRRGAVAKFVTGFQRYLEFQEDAVALALRLVLGSLSPGTAAPGDPAASPSKPDPSKPDPSKPTSPAGPSGGARHFPEAPAWLDHLGTVTATGAVRYGDRLGDQETYAVTFSYSDPILGGPEHAVVVLVDHNLGVVKDLFVAAPAEAVVERLRSDAATATSRYLVELAVPEIWPALAPYLKALDHSEDLPEEGAFCTDWAMALARLAAASGEAEPENPNPSAERDLVAEFRVSAESGRLVGAQGDAPSLAFCLDLITRFAASRKDNDPLRWSPRAVERFLLQWVPRYAILDSTDRALLPKVLDAWVRWAGRIRRLEPADVARTVLAISGCRSRFLTRSRDDSLREPAARAVAAMLAAGVDLEDPAAVARWIADDHSGIDPTV